MADDHNEYEKQTRQWLRADLVIAAGALVVSLSAMLGTWYQTRIISQQLSASVWPYLSFNDNFNAGGEFGLEVENDGLGPAIIRGVHATVDGKDVATEGAMIRALAVPVEAAIPKKQVHESSLSYGQIIRPGQKLAYIGLRDERMAHNLATHPGRLDVTVCYCSILGQCWTISKLDENEPAGKRDCSAFRHKGLENGGIDVTN